MAVSFYILKHEALRGWQDFYEIFTARPFNREIDGRQPRREYKLVSSSTQPEQRLVVVNAIAMSPGNIIQKSEYLKCADYKGEARALKIEEYVTIHSYYKLLHTFPHTMYAADLYQYNDGKLSDLSLREQEAKKAARWSCLFFWRRSEEKKPLYING